jgi:hypothetical protein
MSICATGLNAGTAGMPDGGQTGFPLAVAVIGAGLCNTLFAGFVIVAGFVLFGGRILNNAEYKVQLLYMTWSKVKRPKGPHEHSVMVKFASVSRQKLTSV